MCCLAKRSGKSAGFKNHMSAASMAAMAMLIPATVLRGQPSNPGAENAAFDVASLKPAPPPSGRITVDLGNSSHGRLTLTNVTLSECLRFAFKIYTDDQIVGPDWIKDHHILFNIVAQAPPDTTRDTLRQMALRLLKERFQLALRRETRDLRYLGLVVDQNGVKMHETNADAPAGAEIVRPGRIVYRHVSGQALAVILTRFTGQPIVDMTSLKGQYDVDLQWAPDTANAGPSPDIADRGDVPSLFAAVREQLGLRLEARKGPMEVIVVDHANRVPIGN
ncbi:MAG: TIGR03435 family protein [Acidobacteria bacterium]|nr:TIGR03435 family protein [Acidobacteriota bacterium]